MEISLDTRHKCDWLCSLRWLEVHRSQVTLIKQKFTLSSNYVNHHAFSLRSTIIWIWIWIN